MTKKQKNKLSESAEKRWAMKKAAKQVESSAQTEITPKPYEPVREVRADEMSNHSLIYRLHSLEETLVTTQIQLNPIKAEVIKRQLLTR